MQYSQTAILERDRIWSGQFETEGYEAAWASEAIFFVRTVSASQKNGGLKADIQISPDGEHWVNEGSQIYLSTVSSVTFARVRHFGGYLRLVGELPKGLEMNVSVYLSLKG